MINYSDLHDHYWKRVNGMLFSSLRMREVAATDEAYQAWLTVGGDPTAYPVDADGNESIEELDKVLAPYGLWASEAGEQAAAKATADALLMPVAIKAVAETAALTDAEIATAAKAGYYDEWTVGAAYTRGKRLTHGGMPYEVMQAVTAQAHQPPGSAGMLAIYRPIDPAAGTRDDPKTFIIGMDALNGLFYRYDGKLYLCKADMKPCTWAPGTAGLWQWELVEDAAPAVQAMLAMAAPTTVLAEAQPTEERYFLAVSETYHRVGCSRVSATTVGLRLTPEQILEATSDAKPCATCKPPPLNSEDAANG